MFSELNSRRRNIEHLTPLEVAGLNEPQIRSHNEDTLRSDESQCDPAAGPSPVCGVYVLPVRRWAGQCCSGDSGSAASSVHHCSGACRCCGCAWPTDHVAVEPWQLVPQPSAATHAAAVSERPIQAFQVQLLKSAVLRLPFALSSSLSVP